MERSIVAWAIRALLLALGTSVVIGGMRIRAASVRHRAWAGAMVAMLLLPVWTKWGPSVTAPLLPAAPERAAPAAIPFGAIAARTEAPLMTVAEPLRTVPRKPGTDWLEVLFAVYLAGVAAMLTRLLRGTLQVRRIMRGVNWSEGLVTSPLCAAPVTIGWLRPVLLLPECWGTWPAAKRKAVLIHEREHMRRRDPLVQWLALLNRSIFWFHPLAWWLERQLAALAEEACDAAVLASGHAAHEYAGYLIEMARSVSQTGARLRWAGAVAFSAGKLPRRVRRIMDTPPAPPLSRARTLAAAALCALVLTLCLACDLSRRSSRGPDRFAMLQQQPQPRQNDAAIWKFALSLTPRGANELEADVKAHPYYPDHPGNLLALVRYYQSKKDWTYLDALTLWFIGQHPDMRDNWSSRPQWDSVWDQDGYERGRRLWAEQLKKTWQSPFVYMNAAEFLSGNDNAEAERILLEGRQKFRSGALHWDVLLARHYAWALAGSAGQLPEGQMVIAHDASTARLADNAYAQKVRRILLASDDTELLTRTVEQLQGNRATLEFSRALIERALSIQPENRMARNQRKNLELISLQLRDQADPGSLNDVDRTELLQSQLWGRSVKDPAAKANELLTVASRNTKDANYGTAVFVANMALGEAALARGDKAEAVRHLLAASDAPPTEFLHRNRIDMSLPRNLIDAGERDAVAKFLDRCAKFNQAGKPLAEWAALIRKGVNPDLSPTFSAFLQPR